MKRTLTLSAIAVLLIGASLGYFAWFHPSQAETAQPKQNFEIDKTAKNLIVAPGIVEAVSEEIEIGAEIPGKLKSVSVEEGDQVAKNQIIAVLENADYEANLQAAKADIETLRRQQDTARARLEQAETERARIANGARPQERREAQAGFESTLPVAENARLEVARRRKLFEQGDLSREEFERAERDLSVAEARSKEANERFNTVNAAARQDDLARAEAAIKLAASQANEFDALIAAANAKVQVAAANLAKTYVRAPISGIILRKRLKAGESFSPDKSTNGIVTMGDISAQRVRVDLDEADVAKIRAGQTAYVTASAYGDQKFAAKVMKIGQILGRKNVRTEEPTEKVDRKILEVLLELDPNQKLPLGLRVDAFINSN